MALYCTCQHYYSVHLFHDVRFDSATKNILVGRTECFGTTDLPDGKKCLCQKFITDEERSDNEK